MIWSRNGQTYKTKQPLPFNCTQLPVELFQQRPAVVNDQVSQWPNKKQKQPSPLAKIIAKRKFVTISPSEMFPGWDPPTSTLVPPLTTKLQCLTQNEPFNCATRIS